MAPRRTIRLISTLIVAAILAAGGAARAFSPTGLDPESDVCNAPVNLAAPPGINISNHVFMRAALGPQAGQIAVASGRGTLWSWSRLPGTVSAAATQIACAAAGAQAVVIYKDANTQDLMSMDRLSGWRTVRVPVVGPTLGSAMWATSINVGTRQVIVLFSHTDDWTDGIVMNIWDDNAVGGTGWTGSSALGPVPGGTIIGNYRHGLTGYAYDLGWPDNPQRQISFFVVGNDG